MTVDAGATYPATITWHTPARKAPVSKNDWFELNFFVCLFTEDLSQIIQQPHVVHHPKSEMPPYLEKFDRDMRPMQLCVIIALWVSSRD